MSNRRPFHLLWYVQNAAWSIPGPVGVVLGNNVSSFRFWLWNKTGWEWL